MFCFFLWVNNDLNMFVVLNKKLAKRIKIIQYKNPKISDFGLQFTVSFQLNSKSACVIVDDNNLLGDLIYI